MSLGPEFPGCEKNDQERKNVYDCPRRDVESELYTNQNSRCGIVLEDGGAPKATPILRKRIYPSFHGALVQSLNESRSMSGSCGTRCGLSLRADGKELKNSLGRTAALTVKAIPTASWATIRLRSAPPSHLFLSVTACILQLKPGRPFSMQLLRPKEKSKTSVRSLSGRE